MIYKINVTAADIKNGIKQSSSNCPVALAIKRALKRKPLDMKLKYISLRSYHGSVYYNLYCTFDFPDKVTKQIRLFDNGKKIKPFSFTIDIKNDN